MKSSIVYYYQAFNFECSSAVAIGINVELATEMDLQGTFRF